MTLPQSSNIDSLIRLLDDRDSFVYNRVRENLIGLGSTAVPYLQKAAESENLILRQRIADILGTLHPVCLKEKFIRLVRESAGGEPDLEEGACLIMEYGGFRADAAGEVLKGLDLLADKIKTRLDPADSPQTTLEKLSHFIFNEQGFKGNQSDYFNPENSYLDKVLETKQGIPITLAVICILLGKRLGLPIEGIGLPCHFIARLDHPDEPVYFDPFNGGRILSREACVEMVESFGLKFEDKFLDIATSREILVRMLHNLVTIFNRTNEEDKSTQLIEFSKILLENKQD